MLAKQSKFKAVIMGKVYFVKRMDLLGISNKYSGYFELIEIMNILINERSGRVDSFSREIYPIVAQRFNVGAHTIERNIRNVIDKCWSLDLMKTLNVYRIDSDKPTCQEFIFMIKNYMEKSIL